MHPLSTTTRAFVSDLMRRHFPNQRGDLAKKLFLQVDDLFAGNFPGYQCSDTAYHDLRHTCEATAATARLLDGHLNGGSQPTITARDFELATVAALIHDSGYIKQTGDNDGTGAKYTLTHVQRSADFAGRLLPSLGVAAVEVGIVQSAIHCTDAYVNVSQIEFASPVAKYIACAVGTADILSQMAAGDYPEQLPDLYKEFVEAAAYSGLRGTGIASYRSAEDLLSRTREFYEVHVQRLLTEQWGGVYRDLEHHFGNGTNEYLTAIETNLQRIDGLPAIC